MEGAAGHLPGFVKDVVPIGDGWRIYAVDPPYPVFEPASWRLRIDGLVHRPVELGITQLRGLPRAEQVSDFHCVTGWSVPGVAWAGVRFADLLAAAGPLPSARALEFRSAERPYADSLSLAQAGAADAMLAYEMDGRPLTRAHGAPAPAGHAADVRLQGGQVGAAHRRHRPRPRRLLAAAGL